jgi:hypothetical protein
MNIMLYSIERITSFKSQYYGNIHNTHYFDFKKKRFFKPTDALTSQYLIKSKEKAEKISKRVLGTVVKYDPDTRMFVR